MPVRKIDIEKHGRKRKAEITLRLSEFEIPPMRDILVIGKRAPIGPEAAKRMADAVAPDRFMVIPVNDKTIEAILLRKTILQLVPQERLVLLIIEEAKEIMQKENVVRVGLNIEILTKRIIEL